MNLLFKKVLFVPFFPKHDPSYHTTERLLIPGIVQWYDIKHIPFATKYYFVAKGICLILSSLDPHPQHDIIIIFSFLLLLITNRIRKRDHYRFLIMNSLFSPKYAYKYVFTTVPINDIKNDLYDVIVNFLHALFAAVYSLLCLSYYIIIVFAKLLILAFPHAIKLSQIVVKFHMTQLSTTDICIEIVSLVLLGGGFFFRKHIYRKWKEFEAYVSKKSKAAAKAAPHVMFFLSSFLFSFIGRKFLLPLTSASIMPVFTVIIPLLTSLRVASGVQTASFGTPSDSRGHALLLWIILAIYHSVVTILSIMPFSNRLMARIPFVKEVVMVVLIWAQLSSVFAKIVFESVISRILLRVANMIPSSYNEEDTSAKTSTVLNVLKMMRVLSDTKIVFLKALFQDSVATLLALVFIFTPYPIAMVGAVTISLLLPAFRTTSAASISLRHSQSSSARGGVGRLSDEEKEIMHQRNRQWLNYWICLACVWVLRIYVMNFWPSMLILISLWLQHSYFMGASRSVAYVQETMGVLAARNHKIQMEKHSPELTAGTEPTAPTSSSASTTGYLDRGRSGVGTSARDIRSRSGRSTSSAPRGGAGAALAAATTEEEEARDDDAADDDNDDNDDDGITRVVSESGSRNARSDGAVGGQLHPEYEGVELDYEHVARQENEAASTAARVN